MRPWLLAIGLLGGGMVSALDPATAAHFRNVTTEINVAVNQNSDLGPGAAFTDIDGDGDLDMMLVDGLGDPNKLFRQTGLRTFQEVGMTLGIGDTGWCKSVTFADYDNDGDPDLLCTRLGDTNLLYRNDGAVFTNVSAAAGFTFTMQNSGAAWADFDKDGFLDVYITNYQSAANRLMRNQGNGTFTDVAASAGVGNPTGFGFQPAWLDYDNDNDMDLYVSNDIFGTANALFRNNGNGTFTDVSVASGAGIDMSAMGLAISDYDQNGYLDIYISNTAAGNVLLRNLGDGTFVNEAAAAGVIANVVCWGTDFLDYDNDGWQDLYVAVSTEDYLAGGGTGAGVASRAVGYPNLLYRNVGGAFTDVSAQSGAANGGKSFCTAVGDYDQDGDLDLSVSNWWVTIADSSSALYENNHILRGASASDWLRIKLVGTISNRDGVGARVWLETPTGWQLRERQTGTSYLSSSEPYLHFGLGAATVVSKLYVRWPSGLSEVYSNLPGGQLLTLIEGEGVPTAVDPPAGQALGWRLVEVAPNPAAETVQFRLRPGGTGGNLEVLDAAGRMLRRFDLRGEDQPEVSIRWDGRDERGVRLPAGTYFVRVPGVRGAALGRVILLR